MTRLQKIDPSGYPKLDGNDRCWHIGEYTVGGTFNAGETNNQISNLKKEPPVPPAQMRWKQHAIRYWGDKLAECMNLDVIQQRVTLVPAPCSKPLGHPNYDDRMEAVLRRLAAHRPGIDIRPLVRTSVIRPSQHTGERISVPDLIASMEIDQNQLAVPLKSTVLIIDDVFTQGGTFKAMKTLMLPFTQDISGVFLAKAVWPDPTFEDFFGQEA